MIHKMSGRHRITLILRRCGSAQTQCNKHFNSLCCGMKHECYQSRCSNFASQANAHPVVQTHTSLNVNKLFFNGIKKSTQLLHIQVESALLVSSIRNFVTVAQPVVKENVTVVSKNKRSGRKPKKKIVKYPLKGKGVANPVFTDRFESCKAFLVSLNITTDELEFYPDVQQMKEADIIACVDRLREQEIHAVFSLFLLQRIFLEIKLERTATSGQGPNPKYWYKLRNGMYKLTCIEAMVFYLELSKLLERPDLDPVRLMDDLAAVDIYDHIETLTKKTRKLRLVGATPEDILNNLMLYKGYEYFNAKIRLYQIAMGSPTGPFPVNLFLSPTLTEFKDKMNVGPEVKEITKLLNVKEEDFLTCWGVSRVHTKSLVYKVHMCLRVGIPQMDIFNSLDILNRITQEQCHRVTSSLRKSGQPGSIYVFHTLEKNIQHRTANGSRRDGEEPDWTDETSDSDGDSKVNAPMQPRRSKMKLTRAENPKTDYPSSTNNATTATTTTSFSANDNNIDNNDDKQNIFSPSAPNNNKTKTTTATPPTTTPTSPMPQHRTLPESSKVWRSAVFKLIGRLLSLDRSTQAAMVRSDINMDPTHLLDVKRNLEFLTSTPTQEGCSPFSLQHISQCPIVLAHPHRDLVKVATQLPLLIHESNFSSSAFLQHQCSSSLSSESSASFSSSSSSSSSKVSSATPDPCPFLSDPVRHLNVLQYFLEKENNFSLSYTKTQSVVAFLN